MPDRATPGFAGRVRAIRHASTSMLGYGRGREVDEPQAMVSERATSRRLRRRGVPHDDALEPLVGLLEERRQSALAQQPPVGPGGDDDRDQRLVLVERGGVLLGVAQPPERLPRGTVVVADGAKGIERAPALPCQAPAQGVQVVGGDRELVAARCEVRPARSELCPARRQVAGELLDADARREDVRPRFADPSPPARERFRGLTPPT